MKISKSFKSIAVICWRRLANYLNLLAIRPVWIGKKVYLGPQAEVNGAYQIQISSGFYVRYGLWMDAISRYQEQRFTPFLSFGRNFSASRFLHIGCVNSISIGDDCLFGSNVTVIDHNHGNLREELLRPPKAPISQPLFSTGEIVIGDRVWIGDNVVVLSGAKIGNDVVVGANSVVSGELPAGHICVGAPCRPLRLRGLEKSPS